MHILLGALQPDSSESQAGGGNSGSSCHTSVESTALVPRDPVYAHRSAHSFAGGSRNSDTLTKLRLSGGRAQPVTAGRMENLRENFRAKGISERAVDLILSSWREKTNANYNSAWRKWEEWCQERNLCPFSSDIGSVLDFLATQFQEGKQYRSLNCYRSALSSTLLPVEGFPVGSHPLVCRLLRGVFNIRPPQPRYRGMWEVPKLLSHIRSWGNTDALSLKQLSRKLVVLLALVLANRSSDLARLSLKGKRYSRGCVILNCDGLAKQARVGKFKPEEVIVAPFEDKAICPIACLRAYEKRTSDYRKSDRLFLAIVAPHKPVTSSSVARWMKDTLKEAGLGEDFGAHSSRGSAATAAAMSGITMQEIMCRAGWSKEDTFCRFYYRPSQAERTASKFSQNVLGYKDA